MIKLSEQNSNLKAVPLQINKVSVINAYLFVSNYLLETALMSGTMINRLIQIHKSPVKSKTRNQFVYTFNKYAQMTMPQMRICLIPCQHGTERNKITITAPTAAIKVYKE